GVLHAFPGFLLGRNRAIFAFGVAGETSRRIPRSPKVSLPALMLVIGYAVIVTAWKVFHLLLLFYKPRRFFLSQNARCLTGPDGPMVSILVAAKDEEEQIGKCIRCILKSKFTNFELIVIDDRSEDATAVEAAEATGGDPRVRLLHVRDKPEGWNGKM